MRNVGEQKKKTRERFTRVKTIIVKYKMLCLSTTANASERIIKQITSNILVNRFG